MQKVPEVLIFSFLKPLFKVAPLNLSSRGLCFVARLLARPFRPRPLLLFSTCCSSKVSAPKGPLGEGRASSAPRQVSLACHKTLGRGCFPCQPASPFSRVDAGRLGEKAVRCVWAPPLLPPILQPGALSPRGGCEGGGPGQASSAARTASTVVTPSVFFTSGPNFSPRSVWGGARRSPSLSQY